MNGGEHEYNVFINIKITIAWCSKKSCMLPENECAESSDGGGGVSIIGGIKCRDQAVVEVDRYRDVNRQVILPIVNCM